MKERHKIERENSDNHEHGHSCRNEHGHDHGHEDGGMGCGCGHSHGEGGGVKGTLIQLCAAFAIAAIAAFAPLPQYARAAGFAAAYLLAGWRVLLASLRNISRGEIFDENFLMSVA